jgi:ribonuclease T1
VKRAWFCGFIVALSLAFSGCGKSGPDSQGPAANTSVVASQAEPPHVLQDKDKLQSDPRAESWRDTASAGAGPSQTTVDASQLPKQAIVTLRRIEAGGPFPFEKDGIVFGNRERLLPPHPARFLPRIHRSYAARPRSRRTPDRMWWPSQAD